MDAQKLIWRAAAGATGTLVINGTGGFLCDRVTLEQFHVLTHRHGTPPTP
jgi:hypothetical protein